MPAQYALQPNLGQSLSPHVPGSWLSPRGRGRGLPLAFRLRARSRARRSAAACLRLAARFAAAAFRLRRRSAVACLRLRALKSPRFPHECRRPRFLWQCGHCHVTGLCGRVGRRRRRPGLHRWVPRPRGFPHDPHRMTPLSFNPMGPASSVIGAHDGPCAEPQVSGTSGRGTGRGTLAYVPRPVAFAQVSACRADAARVPRHQGRAAAVRSAFLHPLRLVPVRPGGQRTSVDGTPRARAAALTDSAVASAWRIGK